MSDKEYELFHSPTDSNTLVTVSVGMYGAWDDNGDFIGYKDSLIIRDENMEIEEHDDVTIAKEDIPRLISFLQSKI